MIEQWVIDRLNPLKSESLIILADPRRIIRAGARAVDGWAKKKLKGATGMSLKSRKPLPRNMLRRVLT